MKNAPFEIWLNLLNCQGKSKPDKIIKRKNNNNQRTFLES